MSIKWQYSISRWWHGHHSCVHISHRYEFDNRQITAT